MNRDTSQKKKKIEVMRELCQERKAQNLKHLKKWDQLRASKLTIHRKIIDKIDQSLQIKLSQSNEYAKTVRQYFLDLLTQNNSYLSSQIQSPQLKLQANTFSKNINFTSSCVLIKLFNITQNPCHFLLVKRILEESISKIDFFLKDCQKDLMQLKTKLELQVLEIQNCNMKTLQKCDTLVTIYNNSKTIKSFQSQNDLFIEQQVFLNEAKRQLECQKYLGEQIVQYLQFVQKKQIEKLTLLKQLVGNYINTVKLSKEGEQQHLINLYDILHKNTENKYIEEYFSVEELLPRQLVIQLAKIQRKHENQCLNIKFLKCFLKKLDYEEFDNRNLVLKKIKVFLRSKNQQRFLQKDQEQLLIQAVDIYITVDGFVNVYHKETRKTEEDQLNVLLYTLKISPSLVLKKVGDIELQINVKKWGLMRFSQNEEDQIKIVFNSEDQREQFLEFIMQLI